MKPYIILTLLLIAAALACGLGGGWMCPPATGARLDRPTGNEYRLLDGADPAS